MNYNPYLLRAYEIAKCGGHSMCLVSADIHAKEYLEGIKSSLDVTFAPLQEADMIIQVSNPTYDEVSRRGYNEPFEDILKRIEGYTETAEFDDTGACHQLMRTAYSKLNWTPVQVEKAKLLAVTVASLDYALITKVQHIAEAINYLSCRIDIFERPCWVEIDPNDLFDNPEVIKCGELTLMRVHDVYITT